MVEILVAKASVVSFLRKFFFKVRERVVCGERERERDMHLCNICTVYMYVTFSVTLYFVT